ncbi:MAG: polyprenyl glycosylphosphotransferase [Glaciihabitans sp.]|nr:polyprenyl glycosylphosphotransferase [Glaciihabitans sp.]
MTASPLSVRATSTPSLAAGRPDKSWLRAYRARLRVSDAGMVTAMVILAAIAAGRVDAFSQPRAALEVLALVLAWTWALSAWHTRDLRLVGSGAAEYRRVLSASVTAFGTLAIATVITRVDLPREFFLVAFPAGTIGLVGTRWLWRQWLTRQRRLGHSLFRSLVVGSRDDVVYVLQQIERAGACYQVVAAAIHDHDSATLQSGNRRIPVIGDLARVSSVVQDLGADVVIVAGHPEGEADFVRDLAWELEGTATELVLASRLTNVAGPRIHFRPVEGLPLMHVELPQFDGGKHVVKRVFDVVNSLVLLILTAPLMGVLCVLIAAESPGSPIFRQERVGRDGATFTLFKLRSMVHTANDRLPELAAANQGAGPLFKMRNDPRVTRLGRFIRKYSIDELPQLWNVLIGDMSLVGPRPPLPREVAEYSGYVQRRLYIKPGLTGMWQVNGRSNLSWEESIRLDLFYVENWSLTGDLVILWRTAHAVLRPVGAY